MSMRGPNTTKSEPLYFCVFSEVGMEVLTHCHACALLNAKSGGSLLVAV